MRRVPEEENMGVVREDLESTNAKLNSKLTVLREQKCGLEKRVQVLEKLRTKL